MPLDVSRRLASVRDALRTPIRTRRNRQLSFVDIFSVADTQTWLYLMTWCFMTAVMGYSFLEAHGYAGALYITTALHKSTCALLTILGEK